VIKRLPLNIEILVWVLACVNAYRGAAIATAREWLCGIGEAEVFKKSINPVRN